MQPLAAVITIPASIFLHKVGKWSGGYGYSACAYLALCMLCYDGELVKSQVNGQDVQFMEIKKYFFPEISFGGINLWFQMVFAAD